MQDYFFTIADYLGGLLRGNEEYTCAFAGEVSDFVRFSQTRVRQAGRVTQQSLTLDLIEGRRHAAADMTLSGDPERDRARLDTLVDALRGIRAQVPEDPFLCYATEVRCSDRSHPNRLPEGAAMVEDTLAAAAGQDLVGIHASGAIHAGFANSLGQRNGFTRHSFNLDWSLYLHTDKAVKARYAGFEWAREQLQGRMTAAG